ncbi:MAG: helix-turn-helix transcriptional regulator [Devosia sp.]
MHQQIGLHALPEDLQRHVADSLGSLSPRQIEVAQLVVDGKTSKEIGRRLGISARTADRHRENVYSRLGVRSAGELMRALQAIKAPGVSAFPERLASPNRAGGVRLAEVLTGIAYRPHPDDLAVNIFMMWDRGGEPAGYVTVPAGVGSMLHTLELEGADTSRPLLNAIAFGLLVAMHIRVPLYLTGERRVWDSSWGTLPLAFEQPRGLGLTDLHSAGA